MRAATSAIGPYRILERLGEGGMGTVYLAEQTEPLRRRVALKVIKTSLDVEQMRARFAAERQALALMDHPSIAAIFDAGVSDDGVPFFAMEYIQGMALTRFCDQNKLGLRERLRIFVDVCEAVQHAHQKAIIHRDLKPSNILVTTRGAQAVPKIIDFGLAKALAQPLTDQTLFTAFGQFVGTPRYMSPEQAESNGGGVDTRTDVYSLGAVLYELLVGKPPLPIEGLQTLEALRVIKEEVPVAPSRRVEAESQARRLRGDLDWIVLKALEKDPNRRYSSAGDLGGDVRAFLEDRPVAAGPPSVGYRLRKFARRHRVIAGAAVVVAVLIVVFAAVLSVQAQRILAERDRANREAQTAQRVAEFLTGMFRAADPMMAQGKREPTARELLDRAAVDLETSLSQDPLVRARLQLVIGEAYENLGLYAEAEKAHAAAVATRRALLGAEDRQTLEAMRDLYGVIWRRGRIQEAEQGGAATLAAARRVAGEEDPLTLALANNLASILMLEGKYRESRPLYESTLATWRRLKGANDAQTLGAMNNLANLYSRMGMYKEAGQLYEQTAAGRRQAQGDDHPHTIGAVSNLAEHYRDVGRLPEAEKLHKEVLERRARVLGANHPDTVVTKSNLAELYREMGRLEEAERYAVEAYLADRQLYGKDHPTVARSTYQLGQVRQSQGRMDEAEKLVREARDAWVRTFGEQHPHALTALDTIGRIRYQQKRYSAAEEIFVERLRLERSRGEKSPAVADTLFNLGCVSALQGDQKKALKYLQEAVAAGFSDMRSLGDPDLSSLKGNREFQELVSQLKRQ
ncbi:MAG: serine/threonine-protein kinase [Bryobacteraceae bacterium]|nr:serine/threonine-protein kinase [Bryobacteraceae bacterium]